jgi:hypothetical protein
MSTRDRLNRLRRRAYLSIAVSVAILAVSIPLSQKYPLFIALACMAGLVFLPASLLLMFGGRCSNCGYSLARVFYGTGSPMRISPHLRFCPYCGTSIDSDAKV